MTIYQKSKRTIALITLSSLLVSCLWGSFNVAPAPIKALYALGVWLSLICFPYFYLKNNDFSIGINLVLKLLLLLGIIQVLRSCFFPPPKEIIIGNKWLTLFFNEYTSLLFVPPLFTYLANSDKAPRLLKDATRLYMLIGLIFICALKLPLAIITIYAVVFYPYVSKRYRILIIISFIETIVAAILGSRMLFIVLFFSVMSYLLVYKIQNLFLIKLFCVFFAVAPLFIVVSPFLSQEGSYIGRIMEFVSNYNDGEDVSVDTRTFLYVEMADDLTTNNSWLAGKGAYSHYHSDFFMHSTSGEGDYEERIICEVPFLLFLLRSGIIYAFAYYLLILLAVFKSINCKNKFVQSIGVIAIGWYFNNFIGAISGCKFFHLALFALIGMCFLEKWRNMSDCEMERILK